MKYRAKIPFISSMGSISPIICQSSTFESVAENLLWELNSMRRHDGLPEWTLDDLPEGIEFVPLFD